MIRIDLPAVWRPHLDCEPGEHRWIALDGEWPKACPHADPTHCNGEHCDCPLQPPAVLVEALGECGMCDEGCDVYHCCVGTFGGSVTNWDHLCSRHFHHQGFHDCDGCCPACDDGRPLVELTALCPTCEGDGWFMGHDISVHPDARVDADVEQVDCLDCDAYGYVSAGVWVVDYHPSFVDDGARRVVRHCSGEPCRWWITLGDGQTWDRIIELPLEPVVAPAARIGQWAVRLRRVR